MITLKSVTISKYKSIETTQTFSIEDDITTLVGKNEAGKTAILEALAKSNYFDDDPKFVFDPTHDYPRKEKKVFDKSGEDVAVIVCTYILSKQLLGMIHNELGSNTFTSNEISCSKSYRSKKALYSGITIDLNAFYNNFFINNDIKDKSLRSLLRNLNSTAEVDVAIAETEDLNSKEILKKIRPYLQDEPNWAHPLSAYIFRVWISPNLPKFLYYDEYYVLPSEININHLSSKQLDSDSLKTSRALFELADINIQQLLNDNDYEQYKAELEATSNEITATLFEYWKTNSNLRVDFDIQKQLRHGTNPPQFDPIMKIRVYSNKYQMSLPLTSRSKGFNWFFSFIV